MINTKLLLYKIKLGFLYFINYMALGKGFKAKSSPAFIFLKQYQDGILNRYDVVIRYLLIDYYLGKSQFGKDIYEKMQKHRAILNPNRERDYLQKEKTTVKIIEDIKNNGVKGFDQNSCIRLNRNYQLCDGSHRLSIGLYFQIPEICYTRSQKRNVKYGLESLSFLSENEKAIVNETERVILEKISINKVLSEFLFSQNQQFGRGIFYQSFEDLGIDGQRPTKTRFAIYGLDKILNKKMTVLDIGSNCGFFSIYIANYVKHIEGIEYNESLVEISNALKLTLKVDNVNFIHSDFSKFKSEKKYDLILSFAVHYWIGIEINAYAKLLKGMLDENGYVLFESQNISKEDKDWAKKTEAFINAGFHEVSDGNLCDDGKINRKFSLFKKL